MMNKAFFGKTSCFKVQLNNKEVYFHMGTLKGETWTWEKLKMNDMELGEIVRLLNGKTDQWSTVHKFKDNMNNIWMNRSDKFVFVKINNTTKAMNTGEQEVLRILLERCVVAMNAV